MPRIAGSPEEVTQEYDKMMDKLKGAKRPSSKDALKKMSLLAEEASDLDGEINSLQEIIKQKAKRLNEIKQQDMIHLMDEAGVSTFTFNGLKFTADTWFGGTWPKNKGAARDATNYLESIDASGIIKTTVSADFGREEYNLARKVYDYLAADICDPKIKTAVHPMTLRSWAKRRMEEGAAIDLPIIGLITGRHVKVTKA